MRLRRSSSTPSDTRPATRRRATVSASRSDAGGEDGEPERRELGLVALADLVDRAAGQPWDGTVMPIATAASRPLTITPVR